jgi:hypothetical protein
MSPDQKPEWFQIADADNAASPRKISKGLPIMAIVVAAAIIGVGTVVAQTQDEAPANAIETVAPADNSNQSSVKSETTAPSTQVSKTKDSGASLSSLTPAKGSQDNESVAPTTPINDSSVTPTTPSTPGVANPLGKKPSGGEHEGNEHQGGENNNEGEDD